MFKHIYVRTLIIGVLSIVTFIILAQLSQTHRDLLQAFTTQTGILGVLSYIVLLALAIIIAPVSTAFLLPMAANSWGPLLAALYSISGWTIGSIVSFWISRKYGVRWVGNFGPVKKIRAIEASLPKRNVFWYVVLLRFAFPVDVLSYALGIFSSMSFWPFFWSTVIGITPFTLLFTYASISNIWIQTVVGLIGVSTFIGGSYYVFIQSKKTVHESVFTETTSPEKKCDIQQ